MNARSKLEALLQSLDLLLDPLHHFDIETLLGLDLNILTDESLDAPNHLGDALGASELLMLNFLDLLRVFVGQHRILLHQSVLEAINDFLHPLSVVILFIDELGH